MNHNPPFCTRAIMLAMATFAATALNAASVGDTVIWRNSGTAGTENGYADHGNWARICLPPMAGLPSGSRVTVTSVSLGSRNSTFTTGTAKGCDADVVRIVNGADTSKYWTSGAVNGTREFNGQTISAHGWYAPRLTYSFANGVPTEVGATNQIWFLRSTPTQVAIQPGLASVKTDDADSAIAGAAGWTAGWHPVYEITATVVELASNPDTTATVSDNASLSSLSWSAARTADGTQWGKIDVIGNATLTLDAATNFKLLTLNVAEGKTLTLTGENALTATKIDISGKGTVAAATSSLSGKITGCGNVVYDAGAKPDVTCDYNWCGTLSMANFSIAWNTFSFNVYGNVVSKLTISGLSGNIYSATAYEPEIVLKDDYGFALKLNDGISPQNNEENKNRCSTFRKISGDGSIVDGIAENSKSAWPVIKVYDASEFTGNISLDRANILVCDPTTAYTPSIFSMLYEKWGVLRIDGDKKPTLADGKTWSVSVYDDDDDHHGLVLFENGDGVLGGGRLNVMVGSNSTNRAPLNTGRYSVKLRDHKVVIREIFGFRLRMF